MGSVKWRAVQWHHHRWWRQAWQAAVGDRQCRAQVSVGAAGVSGGEAGRVVYAGVWCGGARVVQQRVCVRRNRIAGVEVAHQT